MIPQIGEELFYFGQKESLKFSRLLGFAITYIINTGEEDLVMLTIVVKK